VAHLKHRPLGSLSVASHDSLPRGVVCPIGPPDKASGITEHKTSPPNRPLLLRHVDHEENISSRVVYPAGA
jgi:hypothetical protein